jgi:serine/threonine-protein kinase
VLEGSVRRSGDQLRVTTQLVNVADGFQIWSETYDRKVSDVFSVQDEIAGAVVAALKVKLLPSERPMAVRAGTASPEAYNQFLLGRKFFYVLSRDGYRLSNAAFGKAIEIDPRYAAAYAWLSRSLCQSLFLSSTAEESAEAMRRGIWAAEKAVALDPELAEGLAARGNARTLISRDWSGAESDFQRALTLDSGDAVTHNQYGRLFAKLGRLPEAVAESRRALEIDPLLSGGLSLQGSYLNASGQLVEARRVLTRALEMSPENEFARFYLTVTLVLQGHPQEARMTIGSPTSALRLTAIATVEHSLGHVAEAQRAVDDLIAKYGESQPYNVARALGWRGDRNGAFEWLDRAIAQNDPWMSVLTDPLLSKLRNDPRYQSMLRRLNLPAQR